MFRNTEKKTKKPNAAVFTAAFGFFFTNIFNRQTTHISQTQETRCSGTHHVFCPFNYTADFLSDRSATTLHHTADGQIQSPDN